MWSVGDKRITDQYRRMDFVILKMHCQGVRPQYFDTLTNIKTVLKVAPRFCVSWQLFVAKDSIHIYVFFFAFFSDRKLIAIYLEA